MTEQPPDAMLEQWLTAYVSQDTKIIGIEHPTEADWQEVLNAHIALRDRLNVRIAEQDKCPHKPATPATDAASEKLVQRLRNWQREMERSSDALRAMPGGNIDGTEMNEAANGSGAVAEALEDAADHITAQQAEIDRLTAERDEMDRLRTDAHGCAIDNEARALAAEARLAEMREAGQTLLYQFDAYRTSDLNHECAHRYLVRYELWEALRTALAKTGEAKHKDGCEYTRSPIRLCDCPAKIGDQP
jgi:hypothetical protein